MKHIACILLFVITSGVLGCGNSKSESIDSKSESIDVYSGSANVADIPKHIEDFKDESENGLVQARAMNALVKIGAPAVRPLIEAIDSDDVNVRLMALNTLGLIGPDAKDAIPAIKKALEDPEVNVQNRAKAALEKIGE